MDDSNGHRKQQIEDEEGREAEESVEKEKRGKGVPQVDREAGEAPDQRS